MERKITIESVLRNGLKLGIKNAASLLGCIALWVLTCWIPYINIGTTIAIVCLPLEMAKGNVVSPLAIFDKKYFKYMGEFFLTGSFMYMGILLGSLLIVPGIVIAVAWSLGMLFLIDKEVNPMEALSRSNKATTGYKWTIFLSQAIMGAIIGVVCMVISLITFGVGAAIGNGIVLGILGFIGVVLMLAVSIIAMAANMGMQAHIYSKLSE